MPAACSKYEQAATSSSQGGYGTGGKTLPVAVVWLQPVYRCKSSCATLTRTRVHTQTRLEGGMVHCVCTAHSHNSTLCCVALPVYQCSLQYSSSDHLQRCLYISRFWQCLQMTTMIDEQHLMKKYLFWFQIAAANGYSGQKYDLLQYSIHGPCQLAKQVIIMGHTFRL